MTKQSKQSRYVVVCLCLLLTQGCTKEKAQAIKSAAEQFKAACVFRGFVENARTF